MTLIASWIAKLEISLFVVLATGYTGVLSSTNDEKLVHHLFDNYNKHIRPARKIGDVTNVTFYLTILQLISVTEKSEEMTTSQYVTLQWEDPRLTWVPSEHNGVTQLRLPSRLFWKPDIVLHNNNDGRYDTTVPVNALLNHTGMIEWLPAAIYKSACQIKVDLFPFDWQNCTMKFRSFTYDKTELFITSTYDKVVFDKQAYRDNGEWTIIHCPIRTNEDPNDPTYQDISLNFIIQRKPLFYVINIIVPCVLISSLSVLVFYLPSGSSEKMTMSISVLLGLTVYLLLLAKRVPETSLGVPLIGAYLLFTMLTVTLSIIFSVIVLNIYHRTPSTSTMPEWVQQVFMVKLPAILRMDRPFSTRQMLLDETERNNFVSRASAQLKREASHSSVTSHTAFETAMTDVRSSAASDQYSAPLEKPARVRTVCGDMARCKTQYRERGCTHRRRRKSRHFLHQISVDSVESCVSTASIPEEEAFLPARPPAPPRKKHVHRLVAQRSEPVMGRDYRANSLQRSQLARPRRHNSELGSRGAVAHCCAHNLPRRKALERSKSVNREHTDLPEADQEICGTGHTVSRRSAGPRDKSMFLYRTNDLHTWRHSPSRSDRKGQTRVRRSCRPFDHVISPAHRKHRALSAASHCDATSSTVPTTPPSGTSTSNEGNATSRQARPGQRIDLSCVSSSSSDTDSEIAPMVEAAYRAPAPCIVTEGKVPEGMLVAANAVDYIANNMKTTDRMKVMIEDWHFVAAVADRLLLWIFSLVFAVGTLHFCLKAILNSPPDHPFYGGDPKWANCWMTTSDSHYSPWSQ